MEELWAFFPVRLSSCRRRVVSTVTRMSEIGRLALLGLDLGGQTLIWEIGRSDEWRVLP